MVTACIPQVRFKFYETLKPVVARFAQAHATTDGGVLLKALDAQLRVTEQLAGCLRDSRASHKIRHLLEDLLRQQVFGLACGYEDGNDTARLAQRAARLLGEAYGLSKYSGRTEHVYGETLYAARSWSHRRRVIIKAEVVRLPGRDPRCNPRFVMTNLHVAPAMGYAVYCQRGDMENRLKELHEGLVLDRTSCSRFWANQFRVLLTAAAYVLLQELRWRSRETACATAQVPTLPERLLKVAVWVKRSMRRLVLHLPATAPWGATWRRVALADEAVPG
jgi:hypothetical protein